MRHLKNIKGVYRTAGRCRKEKNGILAKGKNSKEVGEPLTTHRASLGLKTVPSHVGDGGRLKQPKKGL